MSFLSGLFKVCCGGSPEKRKTGSIEDPVYWDDKGKSNSFRITQDKRKIQCVEKQVSTMNSNLRPGMRKTICSKPVQLSSSFTPPVYEKTSSQIEFLNGVLKENFIFSDLSDNELKGLVLAMQEETVEQGHVIIQQGDPGDFYYVVEKGGVDFVDGETVVGSCKEGGSFGELSLLYDCPRAVSCIAKTPLVHLWKVDQLTFRHLMAHTTENRRASIKYHVQKCSALASLDERDLMRFVNAMALVHWKAGDRIVQKGEPGTVFYIIHQGQVKVHDIGLGDSLFEEQVLKEGDSFGERALLTGEPRAANVTALTDVVTLAIDRETFEGCLGSVKDVFERDMRKKFLSTLPMFAHSLEEPEIKQLSGLLQEYCYPKGCKLAEVGKPYDVPQLWFIRHGRLLIYNAENPDTLYKLESGDHFGDDSVRNTDLAKWTSPLTAVCEDNVTAWVLTRADIEHVIGDIARLSSNGHTTEKLVKSRQDPTIFLSDVKKIRLLGMGAFGKVWLVSHKETSKTYALKTINKRNVIESQQTGSVKREKELLQVLSHPFILHLVSAFQDECNLYLLLPVISGGELFSVLEKKKKLGRKEAAFYSACVIEGLGHFHQRDIAYRDLKLENVLIDEDGYCVIVDLGFAKVVPDKTYTLVGTPEYLAPEVILSRGHDKAVDYWSFGVLVYELLVGHSPFYKHGSSQMDMFKRIVRGEYDCPVMKCPCGFDMIRQLLIRRPADRLGNLANGYLDVKSHRWFKEEGVSFVKLLKKEVEPPFKPDAKKINFDDYGSVKDDEKSSRRLTQEEQELFRDF